MSKLSRLAKKARARNEIEQALKERDEFAAAIFQAHTLLHEGEVDAAHQALHLGEEDDQVPVAPKGVADMMAFAAGFNLLCQKHGIRAAWYTTYPDAEDPKGERLRVSTGGEVHHDKLLGRMISAWQGERTPRAVIAATLKPDEVDALNRAAHALAGTGLAPLVPLSPDQVAACYPSDPQTQEPVR